MNKYIIFIALGLILGLIILTIIKCNNPKYRIEQTWYGKYCVSKSYFGIVWTIETWTTPWQEEHTYTFKTEEEAEKFIKNRRTKDSPNTVIKEVK